MALLVGWVFYLFPRKRVEGG
nr:hypothetical protein XACLD7_12250001 [Xanthomonas citri pv. citri]